VPNQRASNKAFLGGYVDKGFHDLLTRLAKREEPGDRFGFLLRLAREALAQRGTQIPEPAQPNTREIQDQFTNLPVSRGRKYQLRKKEAGLCTICGTRPVVPGSELCVKHMVRHRERSRKKLGLKRRYKNSASYQRRPPG
jgi:hypothetical protein